ncbi:MAG TPA: ATP phosphoribosyltransferase regulatory subunit [Candidatus Faecivivens stercoripullorum]|uniref:ATP phosphoribosyltransferase regulatory subunit n=1 Tax=Candidatus Faecivivens stercoripullorum TaxID=2840805 RepID=A0A9D1H6I0_9FIRM|nr:ATP phosphoribosyltransferase regulatory subunit [Candidatus Faecivivens stercoripullorum]
MNQNRLITPEGTRDLLFEDCISRHLVESKIKDVLVPRGFSEVITPALEFYDVFSPENHGIPQENMYKLVDMKGRLMAVKPDLTMPIARLACTRLRDHPLPLRLYYNQNAYRINPADSGHSDEVDQIGIEVIGVGGRRADLEALDLAIRSMESCGLNNYRIEIGHIGVFNALTARLKLDARHKEQLRELIMTKNYPALNDQMDRMKDMQTAAALKRLPALFGGEEVLDELKTLVDDEEINRVVDYLRSLLADLKELGADRHISLDLGIVGRNEYYTGIVFQGYTEGIGDTVLTGGRYDTLLSDYGMDLPAIGFGIDVDAVARVVRREMSFQMLPDVLVFPYPGFEVKAMKEIQKLISMGFQAEFCICETSDEAKTYAAGKGIPTLYFVGEDIVEVRV